MAHRLRKEWLWFPDLHEMEHVRSLPAHKTHEVVKMMLEEAYMNTERLLRHGRNAQPNYNEHKRYSETSC